MTDQEGTMHPRADSGFSPLTEPLRLVTWNLNHWRQPLLPVDTRRAAWDYLRADLQADVALVQEAVPPLGFDRGRAVYGEIAGYRNWGSAVVALAPAVTVEPVRSVRARWSRRRFLLANTHPGSVAVARLCAPDIQPITLVSVYGVLDGSSVSTMLRVIADLVPLFDSPDGARVILGGDLNVSRSTADPVSLARSEAVLAAVRALGLVEAKSLVVEPPLSTKDCPCGLEDACGHVATWGSIELDHLFVTPSLATQVTKVTVDPSAVEAGLSDHVPLSLELALSSERSPQLWNEEAFAEEIGRRHGGRAREVVEKLVSWADQKERDLETLAGVPAKALTRFPTNGITTEPELIWSLDLNLEPKGVLTLVSIHAGGDVVMHFGGMRHPPFDDEVARDHLRLALNRINGVDIPEAGVRGWPRFSIKVLEDQLNLAKLVSVLDRLATATRPHATVAEQGRAEGARA
ncbi:MAG: endonuclease/exonuclease/phosphatase family protein, partial [Chloroflexota bacterium]|nr:endonuclease/exonuclease/phosphatase family protein [Chloroflexota bacterium]